MTAVAVVEVAVRRRARKEVATLLLGHVSASLQLSGSPASRQGQVGGSRHSVKDTRTDQDTAEQGLWKGPDQRPEDLSRPYLSPHSSFFLSLDTGSGRMSPPSQLRGQLFASHSIFQIPGGPGCDLRCWDF